MSDREFFIDDTTWNDLSMDEIVKLLDVCGSSVGREYLILALRTLRFDEEALNDRSARADHLSADSSLKKALRLIFAGLGKTKKVSFRDHIFKLAEVKEQSNAKHIILALLLLASIALIFVRPLFGIIAIVVMFSLNISLYFADKARIESYFICVKYLVSMVISAEKIASLKLAGTPFEGFGRDLKRLAGVFSSVKSGSWLITNSVSGSLVDVIMDYVRMLFHVDLIKFNNMRKTVMSHEDEVNELYSVLGEIELSICISEFRSSRQDLCIPVFKSPDSEQNRSNRISFTEIKHPLINEAVGNSMNAGSSILLTGSNASGKSTFLKCIAINQIFAQTIHTCIASEYETGFFKVLSSMALTDNILNNESYFVVEIKSLKRIFDELGDIPVMCFVDEVLRGTNTRERIAASTVILRKLSESNALVFAATHDIELTELLKDHISNYHFSETVTDTVTFDYKLREGPSTSRNAIRLLKMFGFDNDIVEQAMILADQ